MFCYQYYSYVCYFLRVFVLGCMGFIVPLYGMEVSQQELNVQGQVSAEQVSCEMRLREYEKSGLGALYEAVFHSDVEVVRFLSNNLELNDLICEHNGKRSPLSLSMYEVIDDEIFFLFVQMLLQKEYCTKENLIKELTKYLGESVLHKISFTGNAGKLEILWPYCTDEEIMAYDEGGWNLLHAAFQGTNDSCIKFLIDRAPRLCSGIAGKEQFEKDDEILLI